MRRIIISAAAAMLSCTLFAQTDSLRAVVNVHNEYNPVHINVNKKSFVPTTAIGSSKSTPEYEFTSEAMPYTGFVSERDTREVTKEPPRLYSGYARAGYGTGNGLDVKAAYNRDITARDNIRFFGALDGYKTGIRRFRERGKWDSRMYSSAAGIGYTHNFNALKLDVGGDFGNRVFNYQRKENAAGTGNSQNSMNYGVYLNGESAPGSTFGYRFNAAYMDYSRKYSAGSDKGINEKRICAGVGIWYGIENREVRKAGFAVSVDAYLFNRTLRKAAHPYRDYCLINADPFIDFMFGGWDMHLGAKMNLLTANGPVFAIAPDIKIRNAFDERVSLYASATGGRTGNSLAHIGSITPYWNFDNEASTRLKPTYRIADTEAGATFTAGAFSLDVAAGYAYTKDDVLQYCSEGTDVPYDIIYSNIAQCNTHDVHVSLGAGYDLGGWLRIAGDCRYDFWDCSKRALLMMKPEVTCNLNAEVKPFRGFTFNVGYNFMLFTKSAGTRANSKNDLSARINYNIFPWLGVYIQGSNLLNDRYLEYAGYEARGARGLLGVSANF